MNWVIYVDTAVGMAMAVTVLVMVLVAGREAPRHRALWIVGVVLLALRALFSSAVGVGTWVTSGDIWAFALGAAALVVMIPAAILRPRWAGIGLLVSAVVQPALLIIIGPFADAGEEFPLEVMLGFYSLTVAVIGGILIASTLAWGTAAEGDAAAPAESSGDRVERVSGS